MAVALWPVRAFDDFAAEKVPTPLPEFPVLGRALQLENLRKESKRRLPGSEFGLRMKPCFGACLIENAFTSEAVPRPIRYMPSLLEVITLVPCLSGSHHQYLPRS